MIKIRSMPAVLPGAKSVCLTISNKPLIIFFKIIFGMQNSRPILPLFKTSRNALRSERERARNDHSLARAAHH